MNQKIKNLAIVAHVDHGKTTLVDELLSQSGAFGLKGRQSERVLDSGELEKERGITIKAKNCAIYWKDHKINLLDTPGHADFGGEVERSLMMVDGIMLLVDAAEGPLPQTRFVLLKALERDLKIAVIINKIDRPDSRIDEVKHEIEDLLLELADILGKDDMDLDIPVFYASAREGRASTDQNVVTDNLLCLLDFMTDNYFPDAKITAGNNLQLLVTNLTYSPYLGQLQVGRIQRGSIHKNKQYCSIGKNNVLKNFKVTSIQVFDKLTHQDVETAYAGDIVLISGMGDGEIGDTIADVECPQALPRVEVEPPTVAITVSVNTSPFSGKEGEYLTSRKLEEFLQESCQHNVSLKYEPTSDPKTFKLKGRGELQLAIVFEEIRRKGFELMLSRPEVLMKESEEGLLEPFELLFLDVPNDNTGTVTEKLSKRKGLMESMAPLGDGRTRMTFIIPSRGLIGYRSTFLTDTRGEGIMSSQFMGYRPFAGNILSRQNGSIIADRPGKATPYAIFNLLNLGDYFILPGEQVYEGMVVGEHKKTNDTNVNVCREKHLSSVRTAGKDENIILPPIPTRTLDWAIDWIDDDEWVEVTPQNLRIRKKILKQNERSVIRGR